MRGFRVSGPNFRTDVRMNEKGHPLRGGLFLPEALIYKALRLVGGAGIEPATLAV